MKRFLKSFRYGNKGFTLVELLIVVAILGILAAIVVPNVANMLGVADVAAANTEADNVELAAVAYLADHDGVAPAGWTTKGPHDTLVPYLAGKLKADYAIDEGGQITAATPIDDVGWRGITWNTDTHQWEKTT